jgi:hypothetical protein
LYLKDKIESLGLNSLLMDLAMRGIGDSPGNITPVSMEPEPISIWPKT